MKLPRFHDLSESARTVITTLVCEGVPLTALTVATTVLMHRQLTEDAEHRLGVEVDGMSERIAAVNSANVRAVHALRAQPRTLEYCSSAETASGSQADLRATMQTLADTAEDVGYAAVLSSRGLVRTATIRETEGVDVSFRSFIQGAMAGEETVSDVFHARPVFGGGRMVSYAAPLKDERGRILCIVVVTADAGVFDEILRSKDGFAGPDSSVDLLDSHGVRLHAANVDDVGHPAGEVPQDEVAAMVAERRFLDDTPAMLGSPLPDEALFDLARAPRIPADAAAFWGAVGSDQERTLSLARRISNAPWTLVARIPEGEVLGQARMLMVREIGLGLAAMLLAIGIGLSLVRHHERGFLGVLAAADALATGRLDARIPESGKGVIGRIVAKFNGMAQALEQTRAGLEARAAERAAALDALNIELKSYQDTLQTLRDELAAQTARKGDLDRVTLELQQCSAMLQHEKAKKSQFALGISDRLRGPLRSVIAHTELLLGAGRGALTDQQRAFVDAIASAGRQELALLTEVIDLSEMDAGHLQLSLETLPVESVLAAARDAVTSLAAHKQIQITTRNLVNRRVMADASRIHQVLVHLLSNAVEFSPTGSTVELSATDDGAMVAFEVADRGPGVPEALWPRLFQPFERAESGLPGAEVGPGLGLAVCKHLVNAHGGNIAARPRDGGGLVLRFTLPVAREMGDDPTRSKIKELEHEIAERLSLAGAKKANSPGA